MQVLIACFLLKHTHAVGSLLKPFLPVLFLYSRLPSAAAFARACPLLLTSLSLSLLKALEPRKSEIYNNCVIPAPPRCQFNLNQFDNPYTNTESETTMIVQHPSLVKLPAPAIASLCNCPGSRDLL